VQSRDQGRPAVGLWYAFGVQGWVGQGPSVRFATPGYGIQYLRHSAVGP